MGVVQMNKAVFLDRDGVLNRAIVRNGKPFPPNSVADMEILPGVADAMESLRSAGFLRIVVTNQPDVARGTQTRDAVEAIHNHLQSVLPITQIMTCYDDDDASPCRKPNPGMLLQAAETYAIALSQSYMIGDAGGMWKPADVLAAKLFLLIMTTANPGLNQLPITPV